MDNLDNSNQAPISSPENPVDYNVSNMPSLSSQPIPEEYPVYSEIKWYKKGWGKAIIIMAIIIVLLIALLAYLMISGLGVDKSDLQKLNNIDNIFSVSSSTISSTAPSAPSTVMANTGSITKDATRVLAERMDRPLWGNPSSTLVIVEFADFQCSVCEAEFPIIRSFVTKHKDELLYIFRNYVVEDENSNLLAQASLCANDQGKFWIIHDKFYTNFGNINSISNVSSLAGSLGMDWDKMYQCIQSGKYANQVTQDMADGESLGVQGTPTFFINGKKIEGAVTMEDWEAILAKYKELYNK